MWPGEKGLQSEVLHTIFRGSYQQGGTLQSCAQISLKNLPLSVETAQVLGRASV